MKIEELILKFLNGSITFEEQYELETHIVIFKGNDTCVRNLIKNGVKEGNILHKYLYALMKYYGRVFKMDKIKGSLLIKELHELGYDHGTYWYNNFLIFGPSVIRNIDCAKTLLKKLEIIDKNPPNPRLLWMVAFYHEGHKPNPPDLYKAAKFYRLSAKYGYFMAVDSLKNMNNIYKIPYGEWEIEYHRWCDKSIKKEIIITLMLCKRVGIPRDFAIAHILPYVCTKPHP